jgi:hypothetical protein
MRKNPPTANGPVAPNCLGNDVSGFAQNRTPFGQNVVTNFTAGGFGTEVLAHLQGIPAISNCPDNRFSKPDPSGSLSRSGKL